MGEGASDRVALAATPLDWNRAELGVKPGDGPEAIRAAAREFEGLLLGQMLRMMRECGGDGGWLGTSDDDAGMAMGELAEQQLAQLLSAQGGIGLANLVEDGLRRQQALQKEQPSPATRHS
jgi:flagellar protein FlgJ